MTDNDASGQESSDVYECPVEECEYTTTSSSGVGIHFGGGHGEDVKRRVCLDEVRRLANELGQTPRAKDMNEHGMFSERIYYHLFDGWNEAVREAGFDPTAEYNIPREDLFGELERLSDELGRTPRQCDMEEHGDYHPSVYSDRFDSWNEALRLAGFQPTREYDLSDEDLLNELERLTDELDRIPRQCDMDRHGAYHSSVYIGNFDGWNSALRSAGLTPTREMYVTDDDLLDELRRLSDLFERPLHRGDMDEHGKYSHGVYVNRFDSWTNALTVAGLEPPTHTDWVASGEEHWNYNGGPIHYGPGWNESKKEQVRERDDRQCQQCGRSEEDHVDLFGKKHAVHHIQKARACDDPEERNHPDNLVTLCQTKECHWKWEAMSPLRPQV